MFIVGLFKSRRRLEAENADRIGAGDEPGTRNINQLIDIPFRED
jgi:hypothetical protein